METNEIIALGMVVLAVLLAVRYFMKHKAGGCCSKDCFKPKEPFTKK
jgi:hypothetical protein